MINIIKLYSSKTVLLFELFILIVFPIILIFIYPPIIDHRLKVMWAGIIYILFVVHNLNITIKQLGLHFYNIRSATRSLIIPTLITMLTMILLANYYPQIIVGQTEHIIIGSYPITQVILGYFLLSAPVQEFIFRSFLISRMEYVFNSRLFLVLVSATIFGSIHLPLYNIGLTVGSYILGIVWANNFLTYRNYLALWLSHSFIGATFLYLVHLQIT